MHIVLTTHNRKPSYVDTTLQSMFMNDPLDGAKVHVLVHEENADCLGAWESKGNVASIRTLTAIEQAEKNRLARRVKCAHATRLALEMTEGECIFLQDDALFVPYWFSIVSDALEAFGENRQWCMIALCSHLPPPKNATPGILPWNPATYWGLVGMYFGSVAKQRAIAALHTHGKGEEVGPGIGADVRLKRMLIERQKEIKLFTLYPTVVHHIGEVSSIGSWTETARRATFAKAR